MSRVNLMFDPVRRWAMGAAVAVFVALGLTIGVLTYRLHNAEAAHAKASLDLSNARAVADTTRQVYRDSLTRIVERLAVQTPQTPDATDRLLKQTRSALDSLRATVRALSITGASSTGDVTTVTRANGDTARRGVFDVRQVPYTARAVVELPPRGRGSIDLSVILDPLPLVVRSSCGAPDKNGIKPAHVDVSAPEWITVELARVEQSPDVCRSPALERAGEIDAARRDRRTRLAVVVGYGYTVRTAPPVSPEPRVFVGLSLAKPLPLPFWLPFR
jgi:hypothetical protein